MIIKILLFSLLVTACGKEVKIDSQLESFSTVTEAGQILSLDKQGIFTKQSSLNASTVSSGGSTYPFSEYSSQQALVFYADRPLGSQTPVSFRGTVKNNKIIIEAIKLR